jgi:hypothetical protein
MIRSNGRFDHLDRSGRAVAQLARRPIWPVFTMVMLTTVIAWWFLFSMAGAVAESRDRHRPLGPGMTLIAGLLPIRCRFLCRHHCRSVSVADAGRAVAGVPGWGLLRPFSHVAGDGRGHDAPHGGADDPHLCRDCRHGSRARRTGGASAGSDSGLSRSLGAGSNGLSQRCS